MTAPITDFLDDAGPDRAPELDLSGFLDELEGDGIVANRLLGDLTEPLLGTLASAVTTELDEAVDDVAGITIADPEHSTAHDTNNSGGRYESLTHLAGRHPSMTVGDFVQFSVLPRLIHDAGRR